MSSTILNKTVCIFVFLLGFFILNTTVYSDDNIVDNPLGFKFGMSSKDAKKLISNSGNEIIKNEVDSKEIRTIIFNGLIVEYPGIDETDKKTKLEFYNDRLMSTLLVVKKLNGPQFIEIQNELMGNIEADFGKPSSRDNMLSYDIWTWKMEDMKLILSTNRNKGEVKLDYTYMPIAEFKIDKELEVKRKGEKTKNPADQMFKDGNFSQQTGPKRPY